MALKSKEHSNIGGEESFTDIWSVYVAKNQYPNKIKKKC